ncbi:MAG TPA: peptidylprolyl isomerase [Terriglobales bacterium]|nr:peptidylprolyl isomerase [Terriglobales bacterium]
MSKLSLFCVFLIAGCALALPPQDESSVAEAKPAPLPSTATLPPDYTVLTIDGLCPGQPKAAYSKACKTVVTRREFEKLVHALNPAMTKFERRQLAGNYAQALTLAHEAERRGLDKRPDVQERLRYARLRTLASETASEIYKESIRSSDAQITSYYNQNKSTFEKFALERLFVPHEKQGDTNSPQEAEMKALADKMHARAAAGEDFTALQKEANAESGIKGDVDVKMTDVSRRVLPENHQGVFELSAGQVSSLISDDTGYYVYKIVKREIPSLQDARRQVELELQNHNQSSAFAKIRDAAKPNINEAYFEKYDPPPAEEDTAIEND